MKAKTVIILAHTDGRLCWFNPPSPSVTCTLSQWEETGIYINAYSGIKNTHSWDGFRNLDHKSWHPMPELPIRVALGLRPPPHFEMEFVELFRFHPLAVLSHQGNPLDRSKKGSTHHRGRHLALPTIQTVQQRWLQASPRRWAVGRAWMVSCALLFWRDASSARLSGDVINSDAKCRKLLTRKLPDP